MELTQFDNILEGRDFSFDTDQKSRVHALRANTGRYFPLRILVPTSNHRVCG